MAKRAREKKRMAFGPLEGALVGGAVLAVGWIVMSSDGDTTARPEAAPAQAAAPGPAAPAAPARSPSISGPRAEAWDPTWDPLPTKNPALAESSRDVYTFAARRPEVVRHIPCFCGCSRGGHTSVESCFVTERDANGRPKWNPMGVG